MRASLRSPRAPVVVAFFYLVTSVGATPHAACAAELAVCVRPPGREAAASHAAAPHATARRAAALEAIEPHAARDRLASRARAFGLTLERGLLDGLPIPPPRVAADHPFDLHPARVFLLSAPDSAHAVNAARQLEADPDVEWVERVVTREAVEFTPDDPLLLDGRQWGLVNGGPSGPYGGVTGADVRALEAWSRSVGSSDVLLAVADTGVDGTHPDLAADPAGGSRIVHGVDVTRTVGSWADSTGHGTAVAGVMAARTGNGATLAGLGVAGVCGGDGLGNPGCRLVPIRITAGRALTATSFDIARAIVYATAIGARAVNLSFASSARSRLERLALYHAIVRGCVVVAASGNQGARAGTIAQYPAAHAVDGLCVQVGAMDPWARRAVFSSYGPGLDVLAPGVDVWTTAPTYPLPSGAEVRGYVAGAGTSLAAPFATGTIGLLAAARPELMDSDFQRVLRASARDLDSTGRDAPTGFGALDAGAALHRVRPGVAIAHDEVRADRREEQERDTLVVSEPGPGALEAARAWPGAARVAVLATVTLPDSFADGAEIWPRVGGTMAVRGDWHMPHFAPFAEVVERRGRQATLRGYLFRAERDGEELWLPLPPDQARFGFTVIGPRRPIVVPFTPRVALAARPNPFTDATQVLHPPGARLTIVDASGRRVRRLIPSATASVTVWDGRDDGGRRVAAGFYWIECRGMSGAGTARVLRLD